MVKRYDKEELVLGEDGVNIICQGVWCKKHGLSIAPTCPHKSCRIRNKRHRKSKSAHCTIS